MSHRAGLPAQRIHRGAHQTATVAHPTATNRHLYATAATTTFRRDELSLPTGPRDRTHLSPDRSTITRSSPPPPSSLASLVRHIGRSAQPIGRNGHLIGRAGTPHRAYPNTSPPPPRTLHRHQREAHRQQRVSSAPRPPRRPVAYRRGIGTHPEVAARTEPRITTSGEPTASRDEMTAPDARATGRMGDPSWVAMHEALPATAM